MLRLPTILLAVFPSVSSLSLGAGSSFPTPFPGSVWDIQENQGHGSCNMNGSYSSNIKAAFYKPEESDADDHTAIALDMTKLQDRAKCVWANTGCDFKFGAPELGKNGNTPKANFEITWESRYDDCDGVWFATWLCPNPWLAPQGLTGEIDCIESCKINTETGNPFSVKTAIICNDQGQSGRIGNVGSRGEP